jgi:squalene-hopene/tetraprenyl-beta-curcumene cyclase
MKTTRLVVLCLGLTTFATNGFPGLQAAEPAAWDKAAAAKYLDGRATYWFEWNGADRGQGATKTSCISCHTMLPFALGRPVLRRISGAAQPTALEARLIEQTKRRVANWDNLDSPPWRLFYDSNERKKQEARGTEAVLNALVLATDDRTHGRASASDSTKQALANLWKTQVRQGDDKGSWSWLNFGLEPWESGAAPYFGAVLAAVAVGTAPGYYVPGSDADADRGVELLRSYMQDRLPRQNLFNQAWALWASSKLPKLLPDDSRQHIIDLLLKAQQADGGWRLAALGAFRRGDGTAQDTTSDGYATGLVLHALRTAGVPKEDARVARGLAWLRTHQAPTGEWRTSSLNRKRDPASHAGRFMSDAATGFAILALGDE